MDARSVTIVALRVGVLAIATCVSGPGGIVARQLIEATPVLRPEARPRADQSARKVALSPVGRVAQAVDTVEAVAGRLYTAAGRTLTVLDISNPARPIPSGSYTFPEEIWSFRVVGSTVFAGVNFYGLGIVDVSDASSPKLRGSLKTPGQAKAAAVVGTRVVVVDHMEGLVHVDISNPARPVKTDAFFLDGYARDVVAVGSTVYAVDSPSGLYVFDLSGAGAFEPIASVQSGTALRTLEVGEGLVDGRRLAALVGGGALQVYDVTTPSAPARLSSWRTPGGALRVALDGALAYVADAKAGVQIVDLSRPAEPRIVGAYPTAAPARDVAASGGLVFVATGEAVEILRR
ncbi:MAG: LVIVD repeat-containing protein [Acidobacteriota bacterium]